MSKSPAATRPGFSLAAARASEKRHRFPASIMRIIEAFPVFACRD